MQHSDYSWLGDLAHSGYSAAVEHESFLAGVKISRRSTVDEPAETLRDRSLGGEIPPGAPLREPSIAQLVGVSRNTVRETFFALVAEGVLRHVPHQGFSVVKLSPEEVADLYRARRVLELAALEALPAGDSGALEGVESALDQLRRAAVENDTTDAYQAALEIHQALVAALGNPRLDAGLRGRPHGAAARDHPDGHPERLPRARG